MSKEDNLLDINLSRLKEEVFQQVNFLRTNPNVYLDIMSNLNLISDDDNKNIVRKLIEFPYTRPPLENIKDLDKCAEEMLYFLTFHDKGDFNIIFDDYEFKEYYIKSRIKKFKFFKMKYHEFVIYNAKNAEDIINNVVTQDIKKLRILNPKYTYIGISLGILPTNRICGVIDILGSHKLSRKNTKFDISDFIPKRYEKIISELEKEESEEEDDIKIEDPNEYQINTFNSKQNVSAVKVSLEQSFVKDENGNEIPAITKTTNYNDGSKMIEYYEK